MVGGERLTQWTLAEGPESASIQLHLREARGGAETWKGQARDPAAISGPWGSGQAGPQGEAQASQTLQGACTGWSQDAEALGMVWERQGGEGMVTLRPRALRGQVHGGGTLSPQWAAWTAHSGEMCEQESWVLHLGPVCSALRFLLPAQGRPGPTLGHLRAAGGSGPSVML